MSSYSNFRQQTDFDGEISQCWRHTDGTAHSEITAVFILFAAPNACLMAHVSVGGIIAEIDLLIPASSN